MSYKCFECHHIFEQGEERRWVESYGQRMSGCPLCGEAYEETVKCSICKSEHLREELSGGVCESCIEEYKHDIDVCKSIGERSKQDVSINGFFANIYSPEEIEELIWADMLVAHKIRKIDCTPFIEVDRSWFAENLAKEVNG